MRKSSSPTLKKFRICLPSSAEPTKKTATAAEARMMMGVYLYAFCLTRHSQKNRNGSDRVRRFEEIRSRASSGWATTTMSDRREQRRLQRSSKQFTPTGT